MLDDTLPLTPVEWSEWGGPMRDLEVFERIKSYSPHNNVETKKYPAILAVGGISDQRIAC